MLEEEIVTNETLLDAINTVFADKDKYITAMKGATQADATDIIIDLIESYTK